jgi:hypothetical protein
MFVRLKRFAYGHPKGFSIFGLAAILPEAEQGVHSTFQQPKTDKLLLPYPVVQRKFTDQALSTMGDVPLLGHFCDDGIHTIDCTDSDKGNEAPHEERLLDEAIALYHELVELFWSISKVSLMRLLHSCANGIC